MTFQFTLWPEQPKNSVKMTVYLVSAKHPCRKVKQVEAFVLTRTYTWAQWNGRRHLLGATAFYTKASALRAKTGYLAKVVENGKVLQYVQPNLLHRATEILRRGVTE